MASGVAFALVAVFFTVELSYGLISGFADAVTLGAAIRRHREVEAVQTHECFH